MADFCHDWEPSGWGCPHRMSDQDNADLVATCRPNGQCFGDFTICTDEWKTRLDVEYEVNLGICEGHGTYVFLRRDGEGTWFEHGELLSVHVEGSGFGPPDPIPPRRKVLTAQADCQGARMTHGS